MIIPQVNARIPDGVTLPANGFLQSVKNYWNKKNFPHPFGCNKENSEKKVHGKQAKRFCPLSKPS